MVLTTREKLIKGIVFPLEWPAFVSSALILLGSGFNNIPFYITCGVSCSWVFQGTLGPKFKAVFTSIRNVCVLYLFPKYGSANESSIVGEGAKEVLLYSVLKPTSPGASLSSLAKVGAFRSCGVFSIKPFHGLPFRPSCRQ